MIRKLLSITLILGAVGCSDVEVVIGGDNDKLCQVSMGGFLTLLLHLNEKCDKANE